MSDLKPQPSVVAPHGKHTQDVEHEGDVMSPQQDLSLGSRVDEGT